MTKEKFLAAVRQYGHYRASDLTADAARKLDEIREAVEQHWSEPMPAVTTTYVVPEDAR